ncbi:hypothetical protein EXN66_Car003989 [Channa argus]|uniref:Uncharacterized protein n=1 Tax=Channa argus TaxID=215402 RepID=A0A6G1PDJ8_CHAAH|nr:hypothetical protein EXN66_Car003989 [Channa argus]
MDQCEDREEGDPPSKTTLCGEPESQTKAQRPEKLHRPDSAGPGPDPDSDHEPEPSCVSMKSDGSMEAPLHFRQSTDGIPEKLHRPDCVSLKSDRSNDHIIDFKGQQPMAANRVDQQSSEVPSGQSVQQHQTHLDSIFMLLEDNIVTFVKNELKKIQKSLSPDYPECSESQREDEEVLDGEDEEQRRSSRESFLKITVNFLRRMKQEELADCLQSSKRISVKI